MELYFVSKRWSSQDNPPLVSGHDQYNEYIYLYNVFHTFPWNIDKDNGLLKMKNLEILLKEKKSLETSCERVV